MMSSETVDSFAILNDAMSSSLGLLHLSSLANHAQIIQPSVNSYDTAIAVEESGTRASRSGRNAPATAVTHAQGQAAVEPAAHGPS